MSVILATNQPPLRPGKSVYRLTAFVSMNICADKVGRTMRAIRPLRLSFCESTVRGGHNRCGSFSQRALFYCLEQCKFMQIIVRDNNVDQALRALKKKLQREGVYREMKLRRHYEKPSEKRAREKAAAVRRARKMDRKRAERDGVK
jgi:small subunit ribosomal protein S21